MRFETRSRIDGKCLFETIDRDLESAVMNSRSHARLCSINPDAIETTISSNGGPESKELWRYGVEWFVNSADYADMLPGAR